LFKLKLWTVRKKEAILFDKKYVPLDDSNLVDAAITAFSDWWEIIPFVAAAILGGLVLSAAIIEIKQRLLH
jgi:hypothetical protein